MAGDGVVVFVCTRVAAGERDGFGSAHVFIGKHTGGRSRDHITTDEACQKHIGSINRGNQAAVVHTVVGHKARHGQRLGRDGGRGGGLVGDCVVGQVGAVVAAGQVDGAARACCLGSKHTGGRHMQVVARHLAIEQRVGGADGGAGGGVVHLVVGGDARHGHGFGVDLGARCEVAHDGVVASFGA